MPAPEPFFIRPGRVDDMGDVTAIYDHHVCHGLASFEYDPPDLAEMTRRFEDLDGRGYPYFAAEKNGRIVGYSYAGPFRNRPGYRYSLECTVYMHPDEGGQGIGYKLLIAVVEKATDLGYRQMFAVIGDTENLASIRVHEKAGFRHCGILEASGLKLGRWVNSVYMQRALGEGNETLPP